MSSLEENIMGIIGLILMWAWFAIAYLLISTWHMGVESDSRTKYWAKYEK